MTKKKLKAILLDQILLALDNYKEEVLEITAIEATEVSDDGDSSTPDLDLLEEIYDEIVGDLF
jgi:hypothetical protein